MMDETNMSSRIGYLVALIEAQCVSVRRSRMHELENMKRWCIDRIGEMRPFHPLGEAREGWLDYFDGDWAVTYDPNGTGWLFWFAKRDDRTLFQITWA